jgi:Flp pilus assembly pilin Flp
MLALVSGPFRSLARVRRLTSPKRGESGQTMAEFALLLTVIALVVVVVATLLGADISTVLGTAARKF